MWVPMIQMRIFCHLLLHSFHGCSLCSWVAGRTHGWPGHLGPLFENSLCVQMAASGGSCSLPPSPLHSPALGVGSGPLCHACFRKGIQILFPRRPGAL